MDQDGIRDTSFHRLHNIFFRFLVPSPASTRYDSRETPHGTLDFSFGLFRSILPEDDKLSMTSEASQPEETLNRLGLVRIPLTFRGARVL